MKIAVLCSGGMSTSMLVTQMRKYIQKGDEVKAYAVDNLENIIDNYDVILLGPQVRFLEEEIEKIAKNHGKKFSMIDMQTFGAMDGKTAVQIAKNIYEEELL